MRAVGINLLLIFKLVASQSVTKDPASNQLVNYTLSNSQSTVITTGYGVPVSNIITSLTVGFKGPILLQDTVFLDTVSHFDRERIPDRVVHSRGSGAFGYFEVTNDITKFTKAELFNKLGKKTRIAVRFSLATPLKDSPETIRIGHGFAIKFYTKEGIWDLVGYDSPVFFIRDPMLFPNLVHSIGRNPVTNIPDQTSFWDFISFLPETIHAVLLSFAADIPDGYRRMNGYGQHTFKMVNAKDEAVYVKFHFLTDQGIRILTTERAKNLTAEDPDYFTRDLYNAIARGEFPSWTFYIQVMTLGQAETFRWDPFDVTKLWPEDEYPLIPVGKFVLNENPKNYFADVEQIGFSPAHLIPGIEPSPDRMLQGRLFSYSDTQRYRLGPNHLQLPVNRPVKKHVRNYQRDGGQTFFNQNGAPNYYPNSFNGPENDPNAATSKFHSCGDAARYYNGNEDNFSQAILFYKALSNNTKQFLVNNLVESLRPAEAIAQKRALQIFIHVSPELASAVEKQLH